jgi:hypothetical protein
VDSGPDAGRVVGVWIDVVADGGVLMGEPVVVDSLDAGVEVDARSAPVSETLVPETDVVRIDDGSSDPATAPRAPAATIPVTA